jgi:hypothetical protein
MTINILRGKSLKNHIGKAGKVFATTAAYVHEAVYGALLHVEENADPCHLNTLYSQTPTNGKAELRAYAVAFGKVAFDAKTMLFTFAKGRKGDLTKALVTSPAEYKKEVKAQTPANENAESGETGAAAPASSKPAKDVVLDTLQAALKALEKHQDGGGFVDPRIMANINGAVRLALGKVAAIAPVAKLVKKSAPEPEKIAA